MNVPFQAVVRGTPALPRQNGYSLLPGATLATITPAPQVPTFGTASSPRSIGAPIAHPVTNVPYLGGGPIVGNIQPVIGAPAGGIGSVYNDPIEVTGGPINYRPPVANPVNTGQNSGVGSIGSQRPPSVISRVRNGLFT